MNPKVMPKWLDQYPIVDAEHVNDLETRAAIHEFMHKLPRHEAQAKAHGDYRRDQLAEAAAHHLMGMQAAHSLGSMEEAKRHGVMYALAMRELGHDPVGEPPPEVAKKAKDRAQTDPLHKFKAHKGDVFSMPKDPAANDSESVAKSEGLAKDEPPRMPAKRMPPPVPRPRASVPLAERSYGNTGHFNYSDHLPEHSKAGGFKNITVTQRGKLLYANLDHHGGLVAHQGPAGDYSVIHDQLKGHARGSVRMQQPHVMEALKNHISQINQAKYVPAKTQSVG